MPAYFLSTPKAISKTQKQRLAEIVTNIHCELTGAPKNICTCFIL